MSSWTSKISDIGHKVARQIHALCVDAFNIYRNLMQAGWYEALEQSDRVAPSAQCPVKRLIKTKESDHLNLKDTTA